MSTPLTEDMIRVVNASIGADGRAVRHRPFKAYVDRYVVADERGRTRRFSTRRAARAAARKFIAERNPRELPACMASMGCICACHGAGLDAAEPCDTSEERARALAAEELL